MTDLARPKHTLRVGSGCDFATSGGCQDQRTDQHNDSHSWSDRLALIRGRILSFTMSRCEIQVQCNSPRHLAGRAFAGVWIEHRCDHLAAMADLAACITRCGLATAEVRAERVGYVVYEDDVQVIAEPFRDTPTR